MTPDRIEELRRLAIDSQAGNRRDAELCIESFEVISLIDALAASDKALVALYEASEDHINRIGVTMALYMRGEVNGNTVTSAYTQARQRQGLTQDQRGDA